LRERGSQEVSERGTKVLRERSTKGGFDWETRTKIKFFFYNV
jgi:hypothetical protein